MIKEKSWQVQFIGFQAFFCQAVPAGQQSGARHAVRQVRGQVITNGLTGHDTACYYRSLCAAAVLFSCCSGNVRSQRAPKTIDYTIADYPADYPDNKGAG